MNCPNCQQPVATQTHTCGRCHLTYSDTDQQELHQLEFLLVATADWPGVKDQRAHYAEQLSQMRARLAALATKAAAASTRPDLPVPLPQIERPEPETLDLTPAGLPQPESPLELTVPASQAAPQSPKKKEPVPFDQWLFSENTIKSALYAGGFLLVLAGLIFIGANWADLSRMTKLGVTAGVTGAMYTFGFTLFRQPRLRIGGVALLGVAGGFTPLNFVVLQIYFLRDLGVDYQLSWLMASLICLALYLSFTLWTRTQLFTYMSLVAVISSASAILTWFNSHSQFFMLVYALLAAAFLVIAWKLGKSPGTNFIYWPLFITAQMAIPLLFIASALGWGFASAGSESLSALAAMLVGVGFYIADESFSKRQISRWASAFMFALTVSLMILELAFSFRATMLLLASFALVYLGTGYQLARLSRSRAAGWPIYTASYVLAGLVTLVAGIALIDDSSTLNVVAALLMIDVLILLISAGIHRHYIWIYGPTWLFIAPAAIYTHLYWPGATHVGLVLAGLMMLYVSTAFGLGRNRQRLGEPFLTAAAALSFLVVLLTITEAAWVTALLILIAGLYLFVALWLEWPWLLLPALAAANLAIITGWEAFNYSFDLTRLAISYGCLGGVWLFVAVGLNRDNQMRWAWPVYLFGALNLGSAYWLSLFLDQPLPIFFSFGLAILAFWLTWADRAVLARLKLAAGPTYVGLGLIFIGHFYLLDFIWGRTDTGGWPPLTATLCTLFVLSSWFLPHEPLRTMYGNPLRWSGLVLMVTPLVGLAMVSSQLIGLTTLAITGSIYVLDGLRHRWTYQIYAGTAALIGIIWYLLDYFQISETQAYIIPLGLWLVTLGSMERYRHYANSYLLMTASGLIIMLGSAFVQSFAGVGYAILLAVESLLVLGWGVAIRSRGYVYLAIVTLFVDGLVQFGQAFVELPRFVQIGIIGTLLLGGGLAALFLKDRILDIRRSWREKF